MTLRPAVIDALTERSDWFTVTRVTVRVSPTLGGYVLDVDGAIQETLEAMTANGELAEILSVSGIAHPPDRAWRFAFRVDDTGPRVAANASPEALQEIGPRLSEVTSSSR